MQTSNRALPSLTDLPALPSPSGSRGRWAAFVAFHLVSMFALAGIMATVPDPSGAVALVFAPSNTVTQAFIRAVQSGGRPMRHGHFDWIVVVMPDPGDRGLTARAFAAGALAVVNPMLAGGCAPPITSNKAPSQRSS